MMMVTDYKSVRTGLLKARLLILGDKTTDLWGCRLGSLVIGKGAPIA